MTLLDSARTATRIPFVQEDTGRQRFRVHRDTMTSPQVFQAEIDRIFSRCWLYVGHESEVAQPGDYVRRPVGGRPLFMVRGAKTGQIHVFHNTCTHRGAVVCRQKAGNAKVFQCFYHAWTFDSEGSLVGVPDRDAYPQGPDFADLGLRPVARVESYRGFVFASYDPGVTGLETYLAGARLFHRTVGLLGAAIFGLAFLPVFYSHLALNDVPTLAPVSLRERLSKC